MSNSSETRSNKSPPAACKDSSEIFKYERTKRPKSANDVITINETAAACHASLRRVAGDLSETSPRKIGVAPGGSMITNSVTNACSAKVTAVTSPILML